MSFSDVFDCLDFLAKVHHCKLPIIIDGLNHQVHGPAHQGVREQEDGESQHATHQGLPAYVAEIPDHVQVLHLHQGKTADCTDTKNVTTSHYAICYHLPVDTIGMIISKHAE